MQSERELRERQGEARDIEGRVRDIQKELSNLNSSRGASEACWCKTARSIGCPFGSHRSCASAFFCSCILWSTTIEDENCILLPEILALQFAGP